MHIYLTVIVVHDIFPTKYNQIYGQNSKILTQEFNSSFWLNYEWSTYNVLEFVFMIAEHEYKHKNLKRQIGLISNIGLFFNEKQVMHIDKPCDTICNLKDVNLR